jgi:putative transposase
MTVREIQGFLADMDAVEVSPDLISTVTDAIVAEVTTWQSRPLEPMYPVVFFDALRVKIRDEATVRSKAVYLALAVLPDGTRDILGIWMEQTEGATFWMKVFTDLKSRGCQDILIAVTDGLKGRSEALAAIFPATLQTCIVHLLRHRLDYASWKERKALAAALRPIYTAPSADAAGVALDTFERSPWGTPFPNGGRLVAASLDPRHSVFCVSPRGPARDRHDQRAGERPRAAPQDHQDARPFPDRRGRHETPVAGVAQHHAALDAARPALA